MILMIDNYDSFTYNLVQYFEELGAELVVRLNDQITIDEVCEMQPEGIVLSPGSGRPEDAGICVSLIQEMSGVTPIFGVCLGHQALGVAFGGKVIHAPQLMHGKTSFIKHQNNGVFCDIESPFEATRYNSLVVAREELPAALCVTAESEDGAIMGLQHITLPLFGVQFHPESILTLRGKDILRNFLKICDVEVYTKKESMTIGDWRREIDQIDSKLLKLLNQRVEYAIEIGKIKRETGKQLLCQKREQSIMNRLREENHGPFTVESVQNIFEIIIDETRQVEGQEAKSE